MLRNLIENWGMLVTTSLHLSCDGASTRRYYSTITVCQGRTWVFLQKLDPKCIFVQYSCIIIYQYSSHLKYITYKKYMIDTQYHILIQSLRDGMNFMCKYLIHIMYRISVGMGRNTRGYIILSHHSRDVVSHKPKSCFSVTTHFSHGLPNSYLLFLLPQLHTFLSYTRGLRLHNYQSFVISAVTVCNYCKRTYA